MTHEAVESVETVKAVVRDKASDELVSVPASATVAEAVDVMARHDVGAVLIVTEDGLVGGIFTERDLLVRVVHAGRDPKTTPVSLVMTRDVQFVSPGTTIDAALSLMHVQRHRHLLVIDGPRVFGLVSMRDLVYRMIRHGHGRFEAAVRRAGGAKVTRRQDGDNV
jgi:CBS domain-containing protein